MGTSPRLLMLILVLLLLNVGHTPIGAAAASSPTTGWSKRTWTTAEGLPDNRILALHQTRDGFLWVGTRLGLARFDGQRFLLFTRQTDVRMPGSPITAIAEDDAGTLWAVSQDGAILAWDGRIMRVRAEESPERKHDVALIGGSAQGGMLVAFRNQVERWSLSGPAVLATTNPLPTLHYSPRLVLTKHVGIRSGWVACGGSLVLLDERHGLASSFPLPDLEEMEVITGLVEDAGAGITVLASMEWPGTQKNRQRWLRFHENQWTQLGNPTVAPDLRSYWIAPSRRGGHWVPTGASGVALRSETGEVGPSVWDGGDDWALCALEDREGGVWIGTTRSGLQRVHELPFATPFLPSDADEANARAVVIDAGGTTWLGTDAGVVRYDATGTRNKTRRYSETNGLVHRTIRALAPGAGGRMWVGSFAGLSLIDRDEVRSFPMPRVDSISGDTENRTWSKVRCVLEDRAGRLWIGLAGGLIRMQGGSGDVWFDHRDNVLPSDDVRVLLEARDGTIWMGMTAGGLRFVPPGILGSTQHGSAAPPGWSDQVLLRASRFTFPALTTSNGLSSDRVWALHESASGALWAGTEHGLNRLIRTPGTTDRFDIRRFTTREGLPENLVNIILEDDFGDLWIGHDRGIYRVATASLDDVASGRAARAGCISYDEHDGLPSLETNGQISQPAGAKGADGRLWFCTARGLTVVDPARCRIAQPAPNPVIEEVLVDEEQIAGPGARSTLAGRYPEIPPGHGRTLEFRWTAPSFTGPEKMRYRYRIEGFDDRWHEAGTRQVAFYSNLPPGSFRFEVDSLTPEGTRSPAATFGFSIIPHVWQTNWFRWAAGACALLFVWILVRWRVNEVRRLARLERELALTQARQRFARDLHDGLGGNLTSITLLAEDAAQGGIDQKRIRQLADTSHDALHSLKDLLWVAHGEDGSLEGLAAQLCNHAQRAAEAAGLRCELDVPLELPTSRVSADIRRDLWFAFRESITNIIRHAHASTLRISVTMDGGVLTVRIKDDGRGFDSERLPPTEEPSRSGHGLVNVIDRMNSIGGTASIISKLGEGTQVELSVILSGAVRDPNS